MDREDEWGSNLRRRERQTVLLKAVLSVGFAADVASFDEDSNEYDLAISPRFHLPLSLPVCNEFPSPLVSPLQLPYSHTEKICDYLWVNFGLLQQNL